MNDIYKEYLKSIDDTKEQYELTDYTIRDAKKIISQMCEISDTKKSDFSKEIIRNINSLID